MVCKLVSSIISSVITVAIVATIVVFALRQTNNYDMVPKEGQEVIEKIEVAAKAGVTKAVKAAEPHVRPYLKEVLGQPETATLTSSSYMELSMAAIVGVLATLAFVSVFAALVYLKVIVIPGVEIADI